MQVAEATVFAAIISANPKSTISTHLNLTGLSTFTGSLTSIIFHDITDMLTGSSTLSSGKEILCNDCNTVKAIN